MFSRDDFKEEGKNRIENKRENGHEWCLVERGSGREIGGPRLFSLQAHKTQSLQLGEKVVGENNCCQIIELPSPRMC